MKQQSSCQDLKDMYRSYIASVKARNVPSHQCIVSSELSWRAIRNHAGIEPNPSCTQLNASGGPRAPTSPHQPPPVPHQSATSTPPPTSPPLARHQIGHASPTHWCACPVIGGWFEWVTVVCVATGEMERMRGRHAKGWEDGAGGRVGGWGRQ